MKLTTAKSGKPAPSEERKVGRPVTVGDERINLFVSVEDRKQVDATIRRAKDMRHPAKLSLSYIFREGARRFCAHLNAQLDKAAKGSFHAKRRLKSA